MSFFSEKYEVRRRGSSGIQRASWSCCSCEAAAAGKVLGGAAAANSTTQDCACLWSYPDQSVFAVCFHFPLYPTTKVWSFRIHLTVEWYQGNYKMILGFCAIWGSEQILWIWPLSQTRRLKMPVSAMKQAFLMIMKFVKFSISRMYC